MLYQIHNLHRSFEVHLRSSLPLLLLLIIQDFLPMQHELLESEGRPYEPEKLLKPESVARAVEFALDATPEAVIDVLSVRPALPL